MAESDIAHADPVSSYRGRQNADGDDEIDLAQLWAILRGGKWQILACIVIALILAVCYLFVVAPTYQANAMLQVDSDRSASPLQGITSQLNQITGRNGGLAEAQIQIMTSRSVLGEAVRQLHLDITAKPAYFPVLGQAIARRREASPEPGSPAKPEAGWWLSHFAWQPTTIKVTRFDIPDDWYGKGFTLRALGAGQYVLYGPKGRQLLHGQVGKEASAQTSKGGTLRLFVQQLGVGVPPTDFTLKRHAWLAVTNALAQKLNISEKGQDSGVVSMTLEGHDRAHITRVVNAVADHYLQQNVEVQSEQAKKSLDFLNKQLPQLRSDVQTAENKLANYQQQSGQVVDLSQEGQSLLNREVDLQQRQAETKMKLAEMRQLYTGQHPRIQALKDKLAQTQSRQNKLEQQFDKLPDTEKELLKLQRDVQVKTQLYTALLNRAQQLRIMKAGTVGNVHIVDHAAVPVKSVAPRKSLILMLALVLGGLVGAGLIFLRVAMRRVVDDPSEIEQQLGLPIYAVIPFSNWLAVNTRRAERRRARYPLLASEHSEDVAVESLRSLRTSLYFAQMESGSNAILVTGPAPGVGKSFVSTNLAYLLGQTGQRMVVVDADMRKGRLHHFLEGGQREPGLSQVLTGQVTLEDALRRLNDSDVQVLPSGQIPPNPSELLMHASFSELLGQLKREFDLVILDAPPVLAVTDAAVIAGAAPGLITFLVARAGAHPMAEIEETMKRLTRQNNKVAGVIFNGYKQTHASAAGSYNYYQYEYKSQT
jgi:tyrosine-protein kinase Etk/Wzc